VRRCPLATPMHVRALTRIQLLLGVAPRESIAPVLLSAEIRETPSGRLGVPKDRDWPSTWLIVPVHP